LPCRRRNSSATYRRLPLLDLLLSFQAAYTAPIIMMSQNRDASIDRQRAISEYEINLKATLEIKGSMPWPRKLDGLEQKTV